MEISEELLSAADEVLTHYGELFVASIKEQIAARNNVASGVLYNSVVFQIRHEGEIAFLEILAEDYFKYVDAGRLPGSRMPPLFSIVKWLESRRLDVLGTDYARTGLIGKQRKSVRNKAIALVQRNHAKDVVRRAFAIAKSIGIRGLKPLNALPKTYALYGERLLVDVDETIAQATAKIIANQFEQSANNQNITVNTK